MNCQPSTKSKVMKKNMIIGAMLWITSLGNLAAQNSPSVSEATVKSFEQAFTGATNVKWLGIEKGIYLASFNHLGNYWIAYYSKEGKMISSGRKVRGVQDLPVLVKESLYRAKKHREEKFGALTLGSIFEMINGDLTVYYVPMQNHRVTFMFEINTAGNIELKRKQMLKAAPNSVKNVIARKNRDN
jgi:hypothetical protein